MGVSISEKREIVDAARDLVRDNRSPGSTGLRFWALPSGAVLCGGCGTRMNPYASQAEYGSSSLTL